jgi:hypothetical protein
MIEPLPFTATDEVRAALAAVGRTEDITFSPDGRRLAIAGYAAGQILLIDIHIEPAGARPEIALTGVVTITSPGLREPHGVAFLDTGRLLVGDREGTVLVLPLPASGQGPNPVSVPGQSIEAPESTVRLRSPGSVAVVGAGPGEVDVLACNNYVHRVTRHRMSLADPPAVRDSSVLIERKLSIPDGIAVSPSRRWIAVSNHSNASVLVYRNGFWLGPRSRPAGKLKGTKYPHGVRFTSDGRFILVADAGAPVVQVYSSPSGRWRGDRRPALTLPVMGEADFRAGQTEEAEGGPKGIDIDRGVNVLVATSQQIGLAFFPLPALLRG